MSWREQPATMLFVNASQVVTCAGPGRARRGVEMADAGVRDHTAVVVRGEQIVAVGDESEMRGAYRGATEIDCAAGVLMPGLVDSHTHGLFGRARFEEQEMRAAGLDCATSGGWMRIRSLRWRARA